MSSIASLFGPTAEEIVYDRNQQERLRQQAQLQQSLAGQETQAARDFYQSGYNIAMGVGKGLAGMFGYTDQMQDPRIAKSIAMRKVFSDLSAEDLNDPSKIAMISQLADEYDLPELKLWSADRERKLLEEESTRLKRIRDAEAAAAETYSGAGTFIDPDGRRFNGIRNSKGVIFEVLQNGSLKAAPQDTIKAPLEERAAGTPSNVTVEQALGFVEEHPLFKELDSNSKKLVSIDLASIVKAKTSKGLPANEAVREGLIEITHSGKVKEKELGIFSEFINSTASLLGIEERISPDMFYDALDSTKNQQQSEAQPEAQQQTKSIEELSKIYDPDKLMTDSLDNSIWLVDDEGNPIQKVSD
jgi:hypothetical protein